MNTIFYPICQALGIPYTEDISVIVSHIQVLKQNFASQVSQSVHLPIGIKKGDGIEIKVEGQGPAITG